jgi:hypothetical protein
MQLDVWEAERKSAWKPISAMDRLGRGMTTIFVAVSWLKIGASSAKADSIVDAYEIVVGSKALSRSRTRPQPVRPRSAGFPMVPNSSTDTVRRAAWVVA